MTEKLLAEQALAQVEKVWVCCACGKMSYDKMGDRPINRGWDVSCFLNCDEFETKRLVLGDNGRVKQVLDEGGGPA